MWRSAPPRRPRSTPVALPLRSPRSSSRSGSAPTPSTSCTGAHSARAFGLGGALGIGIAGIFVVSGTLALLVVAGVFLVLAYNLELFGGRFHTDFWFAASWGAFPALTGWWSNALSLSSPREAIAAAAAVLACFWLSVAQRRLSTPVRQLRRRTVAVSGEQLLADGTTHRLDAESLSAPLDGALRALSVAVPVLAIAAVALRI
jgi:hypothetical protein